MKNKIDISYNEEVAKYKKIFLKNTEITQWINDVANEVQLADFEVSIYFCTDEEIKNLNRDYRNLDEVTDVLSFSQSEGEEFITNSKRRFMGDIVISLPQTERQAIEGGHELISEEKMLLCHGILHLMGYDHVTDNGEMMELQGKILAKLS